MLAGRILDLYKESFGTLLISNKKQFLSNIDHMKGIEFQDFIKWMFENLGLNVIKNKPSPDQGVDLIIQTKQSKIAIQAKKRWNQKIGNTAVQEVYSGTTLYQCNSALVITNTNYTKNAKEFAKACKVKLWK